MTDFQRPLWVYPILAGFLILIAVMLWQLSSPAADVLTRLMQVFR